MGGFITFYYMTLMTFKKEAGINRILVSFFAWWISKVAFDDFCNVHLNVYDCIIVTLDACSQFQHQTSSDLGDRCGRLVCGHGSNRRS